MDLYRARPGENAMQPTCTHEEAASMLASNQSTSWDETVRLSRRELSDGSCTITGQVQDRRLSLTPWAESQICTKVGIPTRYFRKCPPGLQTPQFQYWRDELVNRSENEPTVLLRGRGDTVRGILSSRYTVIDDKLLFDALAPLFAEGLIITWLEATDVSFHMRLVSPQDVKGSIFGDPLFMGIHVSNSEVGYRPVSIDGVVYRQICANGMVVQADRSSVFRRRHLGRLDGDFPYKLLQSARSAMNRAETTVLRLSESRFKPLEEPGEAVETIGKKWDLSEKVQQSIIDQISNEPYPETQYALVNAITWVAQLQNPDERFRLETLAGTLV